MKKSLFLFLMLTLISILLLGGCGGNSSGDGTASDTVNLDSSSNTTDKEECKHTNYVIDYAESATCVKEGLTAGSHCKDCGEILVAQQVIEKLPHIEIKGEYIAPTCGNPGYSGGIYCEFCSKEIEKPTEIPRLEHALIADAPGYAATCTKAGLTDGKYCVVCGTVIIKQMVIDKLSHNEAVTPAIAPSCQSVGYTEKRQCTVCGEVTLESKEIEKSGHTEVIDKAVAANCSQTGLTEGRHCSVCNEVIVKQQTINKNSSHIYEEFAKVTKAPSFSSSGTGTIKCTKCGKTDNITFNKLTSYKLTKNDIYSIETDKFNPAYDNRWKVVDGATNVSSIYSAGDWFGNVGDVLVITLEQEMILTDLKVYTAGNYTYAKIRVKDSKGSVTLEKSITANGASNGGTAQSHNITSGNSIKAYTVEIEITGLKWNDARTLKVSEVEIKASKQDTRIEHTHAYRELVETAREATCQLVGLNVYECFCGRQKTVETPKSDHIYEILSAIKNVSCTVDGYATYKCKCGEAETEIKKATGHVYYKLIEYSVQPTVSSYGKATFKCNNCSLEEEKRVAPLPIEQINHLRVEKIENGEITLAFNIFGDRPNFDIRYREGEITEETYLSAATIGATIDGTRTVTVKIKLDVSLNKSYYIAIRPYVGENYGKIATIRVGGNQLIPIDYHTGNVYSGEVLNSFAQLFDEQNLGLTKKPTSVLSRIITDKNDSVLYDMDLSPIVDLEYQHYVTSTYLYFDKSGVSVTVRWSDTPVDAYAENSKWDGYYTFKSQEGWNEIKLDTVTRYIQIIFKDGNAPYEMLVYGYQCGNGDPIAEKIGTLPTIGEMMGMCGFVASGGGNTPIDSVICTTVLREYHNFGWTYTPSAYPNKAAFFNSNPNWMGNFDEQYLSYRKAGINVIPCVQWDLVNIPQSHKVDGNNLPVKSNGSFVKGSFWDKMNPHTYFMYADSMFAFSARYGSNRSTDLLNTLALHVSDTNKVGLNCLEWIELGNEPEGAWNGIHNYYSAYQLAALTSAAYDGHCRTMVSPSTGGYHLGLKNADPYMKGAMAGVSAVSNEYITAMCYWMKANRQDKKVAFDAFNVHCYMTKNIELPNGQSTSVGISPEEAGIVNTLSQLIAIRDKYYPEKEVWITEFGWDTNQSYATSTSSHAYSNEETGVSYTGKEVQAMWLTRTYLLLSAIGIDKATMYMCEDCGVEEVSVGKYGTAGVIGYMYDENGKTVEFKKDSYYYLYTLKNALGGYAFDSKVEAYDDSVYIYKYKTAEGKTAYAVWCGTSDGTRIDNYQLGIGADSATLIEVEYGDIDGVSTRLVADEYGYVSVKVSEKPIYIIVD